MPVCKCCRCCHNDPADTQKTEKPLWPDRQAGGSTLAQALVFQSMLAFSYVLIGFALAYWVVHDDDGEHIRQRLRQVTTENIELQKKLIASQRELQVELATSNNLAKTLTAQQDESIKLKEELVFYKNMTKR